MRLFVTGGNGFVGTHFMRAALGAGHRLTAISNAPTAGILHVEQTESLVWIDRRLDQVTEVDLLDHDTLVHFASYGVSPKPCTWGKAYQINVLDGLELIVRAAKSGIRRVILSGSCVEYGKSAENYEAIPPDAPLRPLGAYASSKAAMSIAATALCRELGLELAILRLFTVFGEGQYEGNFWPSLRKAALAGEDFAMSSGEQIGDFIPVEKAVDSFLQALTTPISPDHPLIANIGTGRAQTLREFAKTWWEHWNARGRLHIGARAYRSTDVMRYVPQVTPIVTNTD